MAAITPVVVDRGVGELEHRAWAVVEEPLRGPEHEQMDHQDEPADELLGEERRRLPPSR